MCAYPYYTFKQYAKDSTDLLKLDVIEEIIPGFPAAKDDVFNRLFENIDEELDSLTKEFLELQVNACTNFLSGKQDFIKLVFAGSLLIIHHLGVWSQYNGSE